MAKSNKIKADAANHRIPQSRDEVVSMVAELGGHQRDRQRLVADMDDQIVAIRKQYDTQLAPHSQAIEHLAEGIRTWCEANRDALTQGRKVKFANLMTGEVKWRNRPPSVSLKNAELVIQTLKAMKLDQFVRSKDEVNKEAILANPDSVKDVKGITIKRGEDFVIVPFETDLEEVA